MPLLQSSVQLKVEPFTPKELALVKKAKERHHETFVQYGIDMGWWKGLDELGHPIPVDIIVKISGLPKWMRQWNSLAYVLWDQGLYKTVKEARRDGWDVPIAPGSYYVSRRDQTIVLTD